ncbi:YkvA family protein [Lysinibacillus xylanilyticus]|uniref:YkvA family protein n=1 Tax=Lysinibacillus xylanilyticus TaxID=582475 RepID=UPI003D091EF9
MNASPQIPSEQEQQDFYHKLRAKLVSFLASKSGKKSKFAQYLMFVPDLFHLLVKTLTDSNIDKKNRTLIGASIAYFILPLDFIPEGLLGFGGYLDDLVIATFVVNSIINKLGPEVIEKHWTGDDKLLHVLQKIAGISDEVTNKIPVKSVLARFIKEESKDQK